VQIRQQFLNFSGSELLRVARHFIATVANNVGNAIIVGREAAQRQILMLEHSFEAGTFLSTSGIGLVTAAAIGIVNLAPGGLLGIQAEFGIGLAPLNVAGGIKHHRQ